MKFIEYNANPKGRKTGDCVVRALSIALNKSWMDTYKELFENTLRTFYSVSSKENFTSYLKSLGYSMQKMPRKENNKRYTVEKFCNKIAEDNKTYIVNIANHLTSIKNKNLYDIWNCSKKYVGNYWIID